MERRTILRGGMGLASSTLAVTACGKKAEIDTDNYIDVPIDPNKDRTWLGSEFWANRLQDWHLKDGVIQCRADQERHLVRTVALLTRSLNDQQNYCAIRARFHRLSPKKDKGFCGFLIGVGEGNLDYRAASLAQHGSGTGGGFMVCVDENGALLFRDHSSHDNPLAFEVLEEQTGESLNRGLNNFDLILELLPQLDGKFSAQCTIYKAGTAKKIGLAILKNIDPQNVVGGLSLVSSPAHDKGAMWGISNIATTGSKISVLPDNALGPVMGTLYTLSENTLKLTAQFMPVGKGDPKRAQLQYRKPGDERWEDGPDSEISYAFVAVFRIDDWASTSEWEFRIVYVDQDTSLWEGKIQQEPEDGNDIAIALYSCVIATGTNLDASVTEKNHIRERKIGRYTPDNFYFPYTALVGNSSSHDPDLLVFCGDQYYEFNPVHHARSSEFVMLDTLYRWYLWYWSFRDICRDRPTIVLTDDHDILQGNVWGQGGRDTPNNNEASGGYVHGAEIVKMVHHIQCDHNPDPDDPTPIENDIPVFYGAFMYGGVSFAIIEDRKFKTGPAQPKGFNFRRDGELLGERQEEFLAKWADMHAGAPKILLCQTPWACAQTTPEGQPRHSADTNGYLPLARKRAIRLVKRAGALMLSGDQHLATVIRHGLGTYTDGPVQFSGPAGAALFQRWFDPLGGLPRKVDNNSVTGNFTDAYGNKFKMLAAANPKISYKEYQDGAVRGQRLFDRELKSEGYGIIRVQKDKSRYILECWPYDTNPVNKEAKQYKGWPVRVKFSRT